MDVPLTLENIIGISGFGQKPNAHADVIRIETAQKMHRANLKIIEALDIENKLKTAIETKFKEKMIRDYPFKYDDIIEFSKLIPDELIVVTHTNAITNIDLTTEPKKIGFGENTKVSSLKQIEPSPFEPSPFEPSQKLQTPVDAPPQPESKVKGTKSVASLNPLLVLSQTRMSSRLKPTPNKLEALPIYGRVIGPRDESLIPNETYDDLIRKPIIPGVEASTKASTKASKSATLSANKSTGFKTGQVIVTTIDGIIKCNHQTDADVKIDIKNYITTFLELVDNAILGESDIERDIQSIRAKSDAKLAKANDIRVILFEQMNTAINMADCHKDGTPITNLRNFKNGINTNGLQFRSIDYTEPQLKNLIHAVKRHMLTNGEMKRVLVARSDKGNDSTYKHFDGVIHRVAYDCGYLGFLRNNNVIIIQTFGKYIDPSSSRASHESFPEKNNAITIDTETFKLLGYDCCSIIKAICRGPDKYEYEFIIDGVPLNNNKSTDRKNDDNIKEVFVGNAKKNTNDIVSVLGKNMGDKLQVFIQFINYTLNKDSGNYCVATCDGVVLLLCIMLNLPCFYTSIDEVTIDGKKDVKVNEILHYDPDGANFGTALKRFIEEYRVVISAYDELIGLLNKRKGNAVYIKGHEIHVELDPNLADIMIDDIIKIQKYIKTDIYDTGILYFKNQYNRENVPLVGTTVAEIAKIKISLRQMNAYTTRIIDMYPNPVIKLRGKGDEVMFNQTTCAYYNYGVNSDEENRLFRKDVDVLADVIEKVEIHEYLNFRKISLPGTNIKTNTFFEIGLKTSRTPKGILAGGGNMRDYINSHEIHMGEILDDLHSPSVCLLDNGWYPVRAGGIVPDPVGPRNSERITDRIKDRETAIRAELEGALSEKAGSESKDEQIAGIMEAMSESEYEQNPKKMMPDEFNVYEKLYAELFDIYESIHGPNDVKFGFDEYISTMESSLFKIRKYDHDILLREMECLKAYFFLNFIENEQIQITEMAKIELLQQLNQRIKEDPSITLPEKSTPQKDVYNFVAGLQLHPTILTPENTKEIERGMSIMDLCSQEDCPMAGGRSRNKTKKRIAQAKWTHKRARKTKRNMSRHLNKRNKKRHKTR